MRLEPDPHFQDLDFEFNFNSIKVRLEPGAKILSVQAQKFQFHKGAIRTLHSGNFAISDLHFNSIKVRLEPERFPLNL